MSERPDAGGRRPDLSMTQLVASGIATVIATVAASRLGVVGTLTGAAVSSVVTTAGSAILRHYLDQGRQTVLGVVTTDLHDPQATATKVWVAASGDPNATRVDLPVIPAAAHLDPEATRLDITFSPERRPKWSWPSWKVIGIGAAAIFALTIGGIVAVEAATGKAVSTGNSRIIPGLGTSDTGTTTPSPSTSTSRRSSPAPSESPTGQSSPAPSTSAPSTPTPTPSTQEPTPAPSPTGSVQAPTAGASAQATG